MLINYKYSLFIYCINMLFSHVLSFSFNSFSSELYYFISLQTLHSEVQAYQPHLENLRKTVEPLLADCSPELAAELKHKISGQYISWYLYYYYNYL